MFKVKDIFTWGFKAAQGIAVDLYERVVRFFTASSFIDGGSLII